MTSTCNAQGHSNVAVGTTVLVNLTEETTKGSNFTGITLKDSAGNTVNAAIDYLQLFE